MPVYLCETCGVQQPESATPPQCCPICEDARQWVPRGGQRWTTREALNAAHSNAFRKLAPGLYALSTQPKFGIGQRAFLACTPQGNILWDCLSLLDEATQDIIEALGGLSAVAVSHPHFYSAMASWGERFDCPVFIHEADKAWVQEPHPSLEFWSGPSQTILPGATLHNFGGHFPGNTVLHLERERRLLTGDTVLVTLDGKHVAFMWSYPNYVPLPASEVRRLAGKFEALDFEALHSAFWGRGEIETNAKDAVRRSAARHIDGPDADLAATEHGDRKA